MAWTGHKGPEGRNRRWTSERHRLAVRHCGHPTANYPYYVEDHLDTLGTFRRLKAAQEAADAFAVGEMTPEDARAHGIAAGGY